jgi:hypothetical protein
MSKITSYADFMAAYVKASQVTRPYTTWLNDHQHARVDKVVLEAQEFVLQAYPEVYAPWPEIYEPAHPTWYVKVPLNGRTFVPVRNGVHEFDICALVPINSYAYTPHINTVDFDQAKQWAYLLQQAMTESKYLFCKVLL